MTRAALRRAFATLGVVATLAAMAPPVLATGAALPDGTTGSAQSSDVNQNAVEPKAPRQHDISAPAPRDKLGAAPQPAAITVERTAQPITTLRPAFTARATNLVAAAATIAAQPRAPPFSRT